MILESSGEDKADVDNKTSDADAGNGNECKGSPVGEEN